MSTANYTIKEICNKAFKVSALSIAVSSYSGVALSYGVPYSPAIETEYTQTLKNHASYLEQYTNKKIIYVDTDKIETTSTSFKRDKPLSDTLMRYFNDEIKTTLPFSAIYSIGRALENEAPLSISINYTDKDTVGNSIYNKVCAIVPAAPNVSNIQQISKLLYTDKSINIITRMDFFPQEMQDYVSLHEGWHCIDEKYASGNLSDDISFDDYLMMRHKAETLADVGAALDMALKGHIDIFDKIATQRILSSAINGPKAAKKQPVEYNGIVEPHDSKGKWSEYSGAVYYTAPSILALKTYINNVGIKTIQSMSPENRKQLVYDIVETNSLSKNAFKTLHAYHKELNDKHNQTTLYNSPFIKQYQQNVNYAWFLLVKDISPNQNHLNGATTFLNVSNEVQTAINYLAKSENERTSEMNDAINRFKEKRDDILREIKRLSIAKGGITESNQLTAINEIKNNLRQKIDSNPNRFHTYEADAEFVTQLVLHRIIPANKKTMDNLTSIKIEKQAIPLYPQQRRNW